jgi:pimeloyl-ACP methyl ester carboxylesterase
VQEEEKGLPIVLVHGVPTGSYQWSPVQHPITPYLKTYNIDIIGMGKSDKPLDGWDSILFGTNFDRSSVFFPLPRWERARERVKRGKRSRLTAAPSS